MRAHTKTAIAAVITTITLALAITATTATARNLSVTEKEFEILFRELTFNAGGDVISCPITLLGHFFERTIPKVVGTQIGVTRHVEPRNGAEPPCTGGTLTILSSTLPWGYFYRGFSGRLPNITALRNSLIRVAFRVRTSSGIGCLAGTTAAEPAFLENLVNQTTGRVEGVRVDETARIRLGGGFLCSIGGESSFSGAGTVLNLPGTAAITVTLI